MRKVLGIVLVGFMVFGLLALVGCGEKSVTIETDEGAATISEDNGEVTLETEEGETTYSSSDISEEDLGVPIYPGAKVEEGTAGRVTTEGAEGTEEIAGAVLITKDPVSKVTAWYKDQLQGEPGFTDTSMSMEGEELGMFSFQSGDTMKTVMIQASEEGTEISIASTTGMTEMPNMNQ